MWPKASGYPVEPPLIRKMPGRPKKKRRRDQDEKDPKNPNRLRNVGVLMTCKNCREVGHNSRSCKKEEVPKPQKEKGKRGRPRKHPITESSSGRVTDVPANSQSEARSMNKERAKAKKGIGRSTTTRTSTQGKIADIQTQESQVK
ncbi:hypothetical protein OROGR_013374 [Orobanche gracilis]